MSRKGSYQNCIGVNNGFMTVDFGLFYKLDNFNPSYYAA